MYLNKNPYVEDNTLEQFKWIKITVKILEGTLKCLRQYGKRLFITK